MGYEHEVLHPATAKWLTDNGYEYEHEVEMPYGGRADFVATKDGKTFVFEVKIRLSKQLARQVLDYAHQIDGSIPVVVIPDFSSVPTKEAVLQSRGISVLRLDVPAMRLEPKTEKSDHEAHKADHVGRRGFTVFPDHAVEICEKIIQMHMKSLDSPLLDFALLCDQTDFNSDVLKVIESFIDDYPMYRKDWNDLKRIIRNVAYPHLLDVLLG